MCLKEKSPWTKNIQVCYFKNPLRYIRSGFFVNFVFMKKILLLLIFIIIPFFIFAQQEKAIVDSINIAFKAKMLTISEYGIGSKEDVIRYAEKQELTFLKSVYANFLFIKVDFSQPYINSKGSERTLLRQCSYYLAYNTVDCRYYKLGGFSSIDIDVFFKDLELREGDWFKTMDRHIEEIDIYCLEEYQSWSKRKRYKKGFRCFSDCKEEAQLFYKNQ